MGALTHDPPVVVRMFGALEVQVEGTTLGARDLGGTKPRQLLEILLLERGRIVAKDRIADRLWGADLPQRVAATIESYVSVLRARLGDRGGQAAQLIVTAPGGYRLAGDRLRVDVDRYIRLLQRAATAAPVERRALLEAATALPADALLADEPYADWVIAEREHYRVMQVQALVELAECCSELTDHPAALTAAARALQLDASCERGHRAAMVAHYLLGDRDGALRAYARGEAALAEDIGVAPSPQTLQLRAAIMAGEDLSEPGQVGMTPVGRPRATLPVRYADAGGTRIAYQTIGEGAVDIVFSPSQVSNLGATWDDPTYAAFLRRLTSIGRLILFDKRGTGLSDPVLDSPTVRRRSEDIVAVLDAAGSSRAVLFGVCGGGALCMQFAADHPDRISGLILHNSAARLLTDEDYPWGWTREQHDRFLDAFDQAWLGDGSGQVRRNPGLADDPRYCGWFANYQRLAANPWLARRLAELNGELDVRDVLGSIRAPTLVICRTEDVWLVPGHSRYLAEKIPGARLVELGGVDHDPWVGDVDEVFAVLAPFLAALPTAAPAVVRA